MNSASHEPLPYWLPAIAAAVAVSVIWMLDRDLVLESAWIVPLCYFTFDAGFGLSSKPGMVSKAPFLMSALGVCAFGVAISRQWRVLLVTSIILLFAGIAMALLIRLFQFVKWALGMIRPRAIQDDSP